MGDARGPGGHQLILTVAGRLILRAPGIEPFDYRLVFDRFFACIRCRHGFVDGSDLPLLVIQERDQRLFHKVGRAPPVSVAEMGSPRGVRGVGRQGQARTYCIGPSWRASPLSSRIVNVALTVADGSFVLRVRSSTCAGSS